MWKKTKLSNRILCFLLVALLLAGCGSFSYGQTANKTTEEFGNLVLFVQLDGKTDRNFMETMSGDDNSYGSETYSELARKCWLDDSYNRSLTSYLDTISYGQFHVTSYLPQYQPGSNTVIPVMGSGTSDTSLIDAASKGSYDLDGKDLDKNDDGYIDNLTIIVQGDHLGNRGDDLYSHKSDYPGTKYIAGKKIGSYNIINSFAVFEHQKEPVVFHEFLHSVGFPDLYSYDGNTDPVGNWDIMASAFMYPQYPLTYLRSYCKKWLTIDTITSDKTKLTLVPASEPNGNQAYILKTPMSDSEFFVVEYRKQTSSYASGNLDSKIHGTGLIVYRINTDAERLGNTGDEKGVVVFAKDLNVPAKNKDDLKNSFFSEQSGRTSFGSKDLSATSNILSYSDGRNSGIVLNKIGRAEDTISFDVEFQDLSEQGLWKNCGTDGKINAETDTSDLCLATDSKGTLYAAYEKDGTYIKKYTGGAWQNLGTGLKATQSKLLFYQDVPYLLCNNRDASYSASLMKYEKGSWKTAATINSTNTQYTDAVVCPDGIYIGYSKDLADMSYSYGIKKYDGSNLSVIEENVASGELFNMQLAGDGSALYMTMRSMNNALTIKKLIGTTVTSIPCDLHSNTFTTAASNGKLYVGTASNDGFTVHSFDGSVWKQEGDKLTEGSSIESKLKTSNARVLAICDDQKTNKTSAWALEGGKWQRQGHDVDVKKTRNLDLAVGDGKLFAAYINSSGYPIVKYRDTDWVETPKPEEPTTKKPTTAPTTQQPTTKKPTTAPTTQQPTTKKPTTAPTTQQPTTKKPTTAPTTQQPTTKTPTMVPTTQPATTEKPTTAPTTQPTTKPPEQETKPKAPLIPKTVSGLKFSKASATSVKITWSLSKSATGYDIYRASSKNGKYGKVGTTTRNYFTNTKLASGRNYYYKVLAYTIRDGKKNSAAYSSAVITTTLPGKVSIKTPKAGKKQITVKWKRTAGAAKYEVYRAVKKTGKYKKVKTVSSKTSSWTNKKLKKGKRYYYKVRAVRYLSGKKYCGAFSKAAGTKPR